MNMNNYRGFGYNQFPPMLKFLIATNVVMFLLQNTIFSTLSIADKSVENWLVLSPLEYGFMPWQLLSYQFLHGGLLHLAFNMLSLWMFGAEMETIWGSRKFLAFYLICGVIAGATQLAVTPNAAAVGASGSIFGILVAFAFTFPDRKIMAFPIFYPIPARIFIIGLIALNLFQGATRTADGVAVFAHLGGALAGFLFWKFGDPLFRWINSLGGGTSTPYQPRTRVVDAQFREREKVVPLYEQQSALNTKPITTTPTRFVVDGEALSQEQIDEILDKITEHGYHTLTEREKKILYDVSKQI